MTLTSATWQKTKHAPRNRAVIGFTLLELVVVLALLALATALVAPAGFRMIASWQRATHLQASLQAVAAVGAHAARNGRASTIATGIAPSEQIPDLPEGWTIVLEKPLIVQANGACLRATGTVKAPDGFEEGFEVEPPFCRTTLTGAP